MHSEALAAFCRSGLWEMETRPGSVETRSILGISFLSDSSRDCVSAKQANCVSIYLGGLVFGNCRPQYRGHIRIS